MCVCACVVGAGQESNDEESVSPSSNMRGTAGVSSRINMRGTAGVSSRSNTRGTTPGASSVQKSRGAKTSAGTNLMFV